MSVKSHHGPLFSNEMKTCQNACLDNILAKFEYGHFKPSTRSYGQYIEKPFQHFRGHIFYSDDMKTCQCVCLDNFKVRFEYGSF